MQTAQPILLVEDDNIDAMTVKRALKDLKVTNQLVRTTNGELALGYLRDDSRPKPCLILLDLNMPKMNGIEFLKVAKDEQILKRIPVVVLTTSGEQRDLVDSYKLSVAGYMLKSVDYKNFLETIRIVDLYWTLSQMPEQAENGESPPGLCESDKDAENVPALADNE
jgi:CheY-like chemotaxis protein